nr:hypothetical protein [Tanacetum cinerariifolium]
MVCVSSTTFSLNINEELCGFFQGKRGLRQGDPMSPYLFTLVIEVLTLMLKQKVVLGLVPSVPKSTAFFSNVPYSVKQVILKVTPFKEGDLPVKYLGVPLISSRLLCKDCKFLVEKSVFILSVAIWNDMEKLIRGFLLCQGEMKRRKAKVLWDEVCLPKCEGGLGIMSLHHWNMDLMATHIYNVLLNKESLCVKWIHTYKLGSHSFWDVSLRGDECWGWHKLLQFREVVRPFFFAYIMNGKNTSAWYDSWCLHSPLINLVSNREIARAGFWLIDNVADLENRNEWKWPDAWTTREPKFTEIPKANLIFDKCDEEMWRDSDGIVQDFKVSRVWESIRHHVNKVD